MEAKGYVHKYGDNVDTDVIIPARYLNTPDAKELAMHCMEDIDKDFVKNVKAGDIITGGYNFGCGSSREHAPLAIKTAGISCVAAASEDIDAGDEVNVNFDTGVITNITKGKTYNAEPFPEFIQDIISAGGLMASIGKDE